MELCGPHLVISPVILRSSNAASPAPAAALEEKAQGNVDRMHSIIGGELPARLVLEFLYGQDKADSLIMKTMKLSIDSRHAMAHQAAIVANAFMHAGTAHDAWMRDNTEWLGEYL